MKQRSKTEDWQPQEGWKTMINPLKGNIDQKENEKDEQCKEKNFQYLPGYKLPMRFLLIFHNSNISGMRGLRPQYIQKMVGYFFIAKKVSNTRRD